MNFVNMVNSYERALWFFGLQSPDQSAGKGKVMSIEPITEHRIQIFASVFSLPSPDFLTTKSTEGKPTQSDTKKNLKTKFI